MTGGVRVLNRLLLLVLGLLLVGAGAAVALLPDEVRRVADSTADAAAGRTALWVGVAGAALLAVLALGWVAAQRRGLARTAAVVPAPTVAAPTLPAHGHDDGLPDEVAPDETVPGEVVVTTDAVERLLHGLVRTDPDVLAASVTAVRSRRRPPRYDVVAAPRRGADPADVAASIAQAADRAGRLLGAPVAPTVRLRASAVRRVRSRRRVA